MRREHGHHDRHRGVVAPVELGEGAVGHRPLDGQVRRLLGAGQRGPGLRFRDLPLHQGHPDVGPRVEGGGVGDLRQVVRGRGRRFDRPSDLGVEVRARGGQLAGERRGLVLRRLQHQVRLQHVQLRHVAHLLPLAGHPPAARGQVLDLPRDGVAPLRGGQDEVGAPRVGPGLQLGPGQLGLAGVQRGLGGGDAAAPLPADLQRLGHRQQVVRRLVGVLVAQLGVLPLAGHGPRWRGRWRGAAGRRRGRDRSRWPGPALRTG